MSTFNVRDTVGHVVAQRAAVPTALLARLKLAAPATADEPVGDPVAMSLTELADQIEQTHHAYLRELEHLHQHIHKENNILFPRALAMEQRSGATR